MMDGGTLIVVLMVVMVVMCGGMIGGMVLGVFRGRRNRGDRGSGDVRRT